MRAERHPYFDTGDPKDQGSSLNNGETVTLDVGEVKRPGQKGAIQGGIRSLPSLPKSQARAGDRHTGHGQGSQGQGCRGQ